MPSAEDVIAQAERWVGFVEGPGNNETPFGKWYGLNFQPYCAMALSKWSFDAGLPIPASTPKGYAYTPSGANWFKQQGRWGTKPRVGAHVFFNFNGTRIHHVGIVTRVNSDGTIDTVEANTSRGSAGSQRDGGGVWRRRRGTGIVGYGYPDYKDSKEVTEDEEEDMFPPIPIHIAPGESKSFHIEPTDPKGAGFLGTKDCLVVLSTHSEEPVPVWVWGQGPSPHGRIDVSRKLTEFKPGFGWLHIRNEGRVEIGGSILYK